MRLCIQYALTYPSRVRGNVKELDLFDIGKLTFAKPDTKVFPLLSLAYRAISLGGAVPAVVNAANEVAVADFLASEISFSEISEVVCETTSELEYVAKYKKLSDIIECDREARKIAKNKVESFSKRYRR